MVATTVSKMLPSCQTCCDLLKIYYLCGSNNSYKVLINELVNVVICLKFTTFVVATTVKRNKQNQGP